MGPILFLIYINDLCNASQEGDLTLFADDATYSESGEDYNLVIESINRNLRAISEWLLENKLSANLIKTEAMIHTRKNIYTPLP